MSVLVPYGVGKESFPSFPFDACSILLATTYPYILIMAATRVKLMVDDREEAKVSRPTEKST